MVQPLRLQHPNFWFIFVATMLFHVISGVLQFSMPDNYFSSASLKYTYQWFGPDVWGWLSVLVAVGLFYGLMRHWTVARIALAVGATVCLLRGFLTGYTLLTGEASSVLGLPAWMLLSAIHLSQAAEPPVNPATARR